MEGYGVSEELGGHLGKLESAGLRHAQPVAKHQEKQTAVANLVSAALGGNHQLVSPGGGDAFAAVRGEMALIWAYGVRAIS
jgi:hypothetical protein